MTWSSLVLFRVCINLLQLYLPQSIQTKGTRKHQKVDGVSKKDLRSF